MCILYFFKREIKKNFCGKLIKCFPVTFRTILLVQDVETPSNSYLNQQQEGRRYQKSLQELSTALNLEKIQTEKNGKYNLYIN